MDDFSTSQTGTVIEGEIPAAPHIKSGILAPFTWADLSGTFGGKCMG